MCSVGKCSQHKTTALGMGRLLEHLLCIRTPASSFFLSSWPCSRVAAGAITPMVLTIPETTPEMKALSLKILKQDLLYFWKGGLFLELTM